MKARKYRPLGGHLHRVKGGRYAVRVVVPLETYNRNLPGLRAKSGRPLRILESYLPPATKSEAVAMAPAVVADLQKRIRRAESGGPVLGDEIGEIAAKAMRDAYDFLEPRLIEFRSQLETIRGKLEEDRINAVLAMVNNNPLLGGTTTAAYARLQLEKRDIAPSEEMVAACATAILTGQSIAVERLLTGAPLPAVAGLVPIGAKRPATSDSPRFSELAAEYLSQAKLSTPRIQSCRATFRLFKDHVGDIPLESIVPEQVRGFMAALGGLHKSYAGFRGAEGLSLAELLRAHPATAGATMTRATINRHLTALGALWRWAQAEWKVPAGLRSPFAGRSIKRDRNEETKTQQKPIDVADLNRLFAGAEDFTLRAAMLVALYTGMRESEVANLTAAEVKQERGISYIDLTGRKIATGGASSVKSESGRRVIPLHPALIRAAFLNLVKHGPIFGKLKVRDGGRGHDLSKRFGQLRDAAGLPAVKFREFRNSFYAACDRTNMPTLHKQLLLGHERSDRLGSTYNRAGLSARDLAPSMARISYPGLKIPNLAPSSKK